RKTVATSHGECVEVPSPALREGTAAARPQPPFPKLESSLRRFRRPFVPLSACSFPPIAIRQTPSNVYAIQPLDDPVLQPATRRPIPDADANHSNDPDPPLRAVWNIRRSALQRFRFLSKNFS